MNGQHVKASTRTDRRGDYSVRVSYAGFMRVVVTTARTFPRCKPKDVLVRPPGTVRVDFTCDTGIR